MWLWFSRLGSPKWFYEQAGRWLPWTWALTLLLFSAGCALSLLFSPPDYQQGETVRIMYLHVPAAFLSMACYLTMAIASVIALVWRMKMAFAVARSCAPIGAAMTALALFTGAVWGKPIWGTWWEWDARLTSELVLLFLYLGYIALHESIGEQNQADKAAAVLAIVGVVNLPIIHFSVDWWNTLHQGASISRLRKPAIDASMLWPLFTMLAAFFAFFAAALMSRVRNEILKREAASRWVREVVKA